MSSAQGAEVGNLIEGLILWAEGRADVRAVALVGSWARGEAGPGSDVDLVVLTTDPNAYAGGKDWLGVFEDARVEGTEDWGALTSRRLVYPSGLEVEVGVGEPSWAATDPLDPGTAGLLDKGMRPVYDPDGLLDELAMAFAEREQP